MERIEDFRDIRARRLRRGRNLDEVEAMTHQKHFFI
jgi:hypothetical protein